KKWMQDNPRFQENYESMKQTVLQDPEISEFLSSHPQLSQAELNKSLMKLYEYKTQSKQCDKCASFGQCINMIQGYSPVLRADNDEIHLTYEKCHNRIAAEKQKEQEQLIKSLYMPKEILKADFSHMDTEDPGRRTIVKNLVHFGLEAQTKIPAKGFYLAGPFGIG